MKRLVAVALLSASLVGVSSQVFASEHGEAEAAADHGHGQDHVPHLSDVNWFEGVFSREEGTPVPLIALLLNTAVLAYLIGRFGGPGIKNGLLSRQRQILSDVDAAAAMKREAEAQLEEYESRLKRLEVETQEIQRSMVEQAELERQRLIAEAEAQRLHMVKDAEERLIHELRTQREHLVRETISAAMQLAEQGLKQDSRAGGDEQLVSRLLASVDGAPKTAEVRS